MASNSARVSQGNIKAVLIAVFQKLLQKRASPLT